VSALTLRVHSLAAPLTASRTLFAFCRKYKTYEASLLQQKRRLKAQIPDIESSLAVVRDLKARLEGGAEPFTAHFGLADQVYAKAQITPENKVCLWLGANVMLEYGYDEAEALLATNLAVAQAKQTEVREDLDFIRDNVVITEVNMARAFNHDVITRREAKRGGAVAK
jgi:prefoldin subunit 5